MRLNSSVLTKVVEQEPKQFWMIGAGAEPKTFEWWGQNRNLKLGSDYTVLVCGASVLYI